jgi:glycosyltransferase involved in cell wall biosynthesis
MSDISPKHSILVLTYNQEDLIRNAINSIITQSCLPYEIIIGDDASSDNTLAIIEDTLKNYKGRFKIISHKNNKGVFGNLNYLLDFINGDIVSFLAGDDVFKPGLLNELNKVVLKENILLNSKYVIVTNTCSIDPNGNIDIWDDFKYKESNAFKQRIRCSINYRLIGISSQLIKSVGKIRDDIGYHADWIWCLKIDQNSSRHYYSKFISSEYKIGVGVVSKSKEETLIESRLKVINEIKNEFSASLTNRDVLYLRLDMAYHKYLLDKNFITYFKYFYLYVLNLNNINNNNYLKNYKKLIPVKLLMYLVKIKKYLI